MALDRFPGAAGGDAHFLVVVAGRAAGGEGIAEPEIVRYRQLVGDVGERRRSLIGRDHKIGIVAVMAHHVGRRDHAGRSGSDIVGDIEQRRDEHFVGGDAFRLDGFARSAGRQKFRHEAPLGPDRHDHRVLDVLRLDQSQDLGAEILRPVRPANAAARHFAEAQVHRFDTRRIEEDLVERPRQRHGVDLAAGKLDRDKLLGVTVAAELVKIGANGGGDRVDEMTEDAVFVEALNRLQRRFNFRGYRASRAVRSSGATAKCGSKRVLNRLTICAAMPGYLRSVTHM